MFHEAAEGGVDDVLELLCQYRGTRPVKDWPIESGKTSIKLFGGANQSGRKLVKIGARGYTRGLLYSLFHFSCLVQLSHCPFEQSWGRLFEARLA